MNLGKILKKNLKGVGNTMAMFGIPGGSIVERMGKMINKPKSRPATTYTPAPVAPSAVAPSAVAPSVSANASNKNMLLIVGVAIAVIFLVMRQK